MAIKLIKTVGGSSGTPEKCKCGSIHFIKSGNGWSCSDCLVYFYADLQTFTNAISLKSNLKKLNEMHSELRSMVNELEELVKE